MPDVRDMKCIICEEVKTVEEISKFQGMCEDCSMALEETAETFENESGGREEDLADAGQDIQGAVKRYNRRKEYMKEYNERPGVKAKRKAYMKAAAARDRAAIRKAKDLGLL
jgi:DNA-binding protein H-NS